MAGTIATTKKVYKGVKKANTKRKELRDRRQKRKAKRALATAARGPRSPFMVRHTWTAKSVDWFTELIWRRLDKQEVKAGKITESEFEAYKNNPASIEQWRKNMVLLRSEERARQRDLRTPGQWSLVSQTITINETNVVGQPAAQPVPQPAAQPAAQPVPQPAAFKTPQPRKPAGRPAPRPAPRYRAPQKRTGPVKKIDRVVQLRAVWGDQWNRQKEIAMSDANVQAAIACLEALADQQPTDRGQLHAQLAALASVGHAVGAASEKIKSTLERPQRDGSPGVPVEVTTHLSPVAEAGATIADACQDTANAFEDRFAEAIKVAQDEGKMSDEFLKKQPA